MDNSKVNGLSVPSQTPMTAAELRRASEAATDRFARAMVGGARISDRTREAPQKDPEVGDRRWQAPVGASVGGIAREFATETPTRELAVPSRASSGELMQMLERMCSSLYVGEKAVGTQRVVMALDHVLPGAAAEIVREGVHLTIRLHARTEESYRAMSLQRDALVRALNGDSHRRVDVSVVHGDEQSLGERHG